MLAACSGEAPAPAEPAVRPVKMLTIGGAGDAATMEFPGSIEAAKSAEIAFEVSGQITELSVIEGEQVESGALLAKLDPRDYAAARDAALAERDAARTDFERYETALEAGAVTKQEFDRARRNFDVSEADLRKAQKAVDDTVLRAPFAGRIAIVRVEAFEAVQAKQGILLLQDETGLEIEIAVAERDFAQSEAGLTLEQLNERIKPRVEMAALPGEVFPARIVSSTGTADPVTRTYAVTLAFDKPPELNILPGMTGRVVINVRQDTESGAAFMIPAAAVAADENNQPYVWVIDQGTGAVSARSVTVGQMSGADIVVLDGLADGDRIATSGVYSLVEGMRVRPL